MLEKMATNFKGIGVRLRCDKCFEDILVREDNWKEAKFCPYCGE